jgi:hypothetical protein
VAGGNLESLEWFVHNSSTESRSKARLLAGEEGITYGYMLRMVHSCGGNRAQKTTQDKTQGEEGYGKES